jgi:hypothetical protein
MATADFTVAAPSPTAAVNADLLGAQQTQQAQRIRTDAGLQQGRLNQDYQWSMPQLVSGIAANGQAYSTANRNTQAHAANQFQNGSFDIQSAAQRQLQDLTRQRMFAATGLII